MVFLEVQVFPLTVLVPQLSPIIIFFFKLNDILHCPDASTSVLPAMLDNNCYITLFPTYFYIQNMETRTILFSGKSSKLFYPFSSLSPSTHGHASFLSVCVGSDVWHSHLGHPSSLVLKLLFSKHSNKLPVSGN